MRRAPTDDDGSAVVEFVTLGLLLLMPVVYLVVTLGRIQAATYATEAAARSAARAVATADDEARARRDALAAVRVALLDQGFDTDPAAALTLTCPATSCLEPGTRVSTSVTVDVVLPGIPSAVDDLVPAHVEVTSRSADTVDAFRAAP